MKLIFLGLPIAFLLASCSLQDGDLQSSKSPPIITGKITGATGKGNVYVVLYDLGSKRPEPIADQMVPPGRWFDFSAPVGAEFGVAAFQDLNDNLRQDVGEPAGYTRFPKIVASAKGGAQPAPPRTITLRRRTKSIKNPLVVPRGHVPVAKGGGGSQRKAPPLPSKKQVVPKAPPKKAIAKRSAKPLTPLQPPLVRRPELGGVVNLGDARFGAEAAALGFSNPNGFLKAYGTGVYLTDAYRSNKTPVLFIHGAGSAAQDWRRLFSRLDLGRFQPFVYHYPTGAPFERSAGTLRDMMGSLSKRYRFKNYHVVGHGTGGLIGRRLIQMNGRGSTLSLVTLGTPWDGLSLAATKVRRSHSSWDVRSNSPFLRTVKRQALPSNVPHHLLFGYKNPNTLASQLAPSVQSAAARVYGFNADERGILSDNAVAEQVNRALRASRR